MKTYCHRLIDMFEISYSIFRCQINPLITRCQLEDAYQQIDQLPIPITLKSIIVQNQEDCYERLVSEKLCTKICSILESCHIHYLSLVKLLQPTHIYKLINTLSQKNRLITSLDFSNNDFGCTGIKILCQSKLLFVRNLILKKSRIADTGVELLAKRRWKHLNLLDLGDNGITNKGLKLLIKSSAMPQLKQLLLDKNTITRDGYKLFSKHRWVLTELYLNDCQSNAQIIKVMSRMDCNQLQFVYIRVSNCDEQLLNACGMAKVDAVCFGRLWPISRPSVFSCGRLKYERVGNRNAMVNLRNKGIKLN